MPIVDLVHFPLDDRAFRRHILALIQLRHGASDGDTLEAVQQAARGRYPGAVIRQLEPVAEAADRFERVRWYAYRDGSPLQSEVVEGAMGRQSPPTRRADGAVPSTPAFRIWPSRWGISEVRVFTDDPDLGLDLFTQQSIGRAITQADSRPDIERTVRNLVGERYAVHVIDRPLLVDRRRGEVSIVLRRLRR